MDGAGYLKLHLIGQNQIEVYNSEWKYEFITHLCDKHIACAIIEITIFFRYIVCIC